MEELYRAWAVLMQLRTPAEVASNWWVDYWLAWHQAVLPPPMVSRI